jgi:hypothetical protein
MKKSTLFVAALAFGMTTAFAQDLTSKKGESYLPEEGDYAIGIDAYPMLNYFGNMFNGTQNNTPFGWNYTNANAMITGKMFTSPTTAYRVAIRIGFTSNSSTAMIADANGTAPTFPALPSMVEDKMKMSSRFIGLGGGMEWRRGNTRLQGYWGGMAMIWMAGSKESYEYGNAMTNTSSAAAISTNWGSNINPATTYGANARVLSDKAGSTFGVGVRGFIGAEYFILPKLSIGGEFGWGFGFSSTGVGETEYEAVAGAPATVGTVTEENGTKSSGLWIDTDNNAFGMAPAAILIHFHF